MKRHVLAFCLAIVLSLSLVGGVAVERASAAPSSKACHGQAVSSIVHLGQDLGVSGAGNIAKALGISVQDGQELIRAFCDS